MSSMGWEKKQREHWQQSEKSSVDPSEFEEITVGCLSQREKRRVKNITEGRKAEKQQKILICARKGAKYCNNSDI